MSYADLKTTATEKLDDGLLPLFGIERGDECLNGRKNTP